MRKCRNGWHLDDAKGYAGICSYCILKLNHPTLRRFNDLRNTRLERGSRSLPNLQPTTGQMPMRQRGINPERLHADYRQAASLLQDDLVWSGDFDNIRYDLMELIKLQADLKIYPAALTSIVQTLIAEENDLSIGE